MKKYLSLLLFASFLFPASAQQINVEKMLTQRFLSCDDIYYNNAELIPKYHRQHAMDTVQALVSYWEQACGELEPVFRTKTLLDIENNAQITQMNAPKVFAGLRYYLNEKKMFEWYYRSALEQNQFFGRNRLLNVYGNYYDFTKRWALKLLQDKKTDIDQKFVLKVYAGQIKTLDSLKKAPYNKGVLYDVYTKSMEHQGEYAQNYNYYYNIYGGLWVPTGNLAYLGNHPQLGLRVGAYYKKWTFDMDLAVTLRDAKNEYLSVNNGELMPTKKFVKPFLGINAAYHFYQTPKTSLYISGGFGYESISTFSAKDNLEDNNREIYLNSFNFNTGLGIKFYIKNSYLSLEAKYRISNFDNSPGTDLSGNAFGFNFIYGHSYSTMSQRYYSFF